MLSLTTLPHRALATTLTPVQVTTMAKLSIVALVMPSNWEIILLAQVMIVTLFKCQLILINHARSILLLTFVKNGSWPSLHHMMLMTRDLDLSTLGTCLEVSAPAFPLLSPTGTSQQLPQARMPSPFFYNKRRMARGFSTTSNLSPTLSRFML